MDWKYKHFNQEAVFNASVQSVLEAARSVAAESLEVIHDTTDGFVARGRSTWHTAIATFRITPDPDGTQVAVEMLVERAATRSYILVDIGGYYNGQIDTIPLDLALFPQASGSFQGPFSIGASVIGLLAFIAAFFYAAYPDASASRAIRERLQRIQNKERK